MIEDPIFYEVDQNPPKSLSETLVDVEGDAKLYDPHPQEIKLTPNLNLSLSIPIKKENSEPKKVLKPWYEMIDRPRS